MRIGVQMRSDEGWPIPSWTAGFRQVRDWGYDCVELAANGPDTGEALDLCRLPTERIAELVDQARELGLAVSSFQCHHGYSVADPGRLREEIDHTKRMLDAASRSGVTLVHTVSGMAPPYPAMPTSPVLADPDSRPGPRLSDHDYWQTLRAVYAELLDHAARRGVKLGVEQVFVYTVCNRATLRRLFDLVGRDDLYWNLDPGHFVFHQEPIRPAVREFGARIASVHVKDARLADDPEGVAAGTVHAAPGGRRFEFVRPGTGAVDQLGLLRTLRQVGYDGALILELAHSTPNRGNVVRDFPGWYRGLLQEAGSP